MTDPRPSLQNSAPADPVAAYLAEVRERAEAATVGPWHAVWVQIGRRRNEADCEPLFNVRDLSGTPTAADYRKREADAAFIVSARSAVPRLLAAVERLLKLADTLEPQGPPSSALEEDRMWIRQECADMIREAISRALLGEGETDA